MNVTVSGVEATLREVLKTTDDESPVVTVPSLPSLSSVVGAVEAHPCRLVVDGGVLEASDWPLLGRLSTATDDGTKVRVSPVDQTAIATTDAIANICTDTPTPTGVVAPPSSPEVVDWYKSIWRDASPRQITCSTYEEVINAAAAVGGDTAADDVRRLCQSARGDGDESVGVAIWAAASASPEVTTLRDEIVPRLGSSARTVSRRVRELESSGFVNRLPNPSDNSPGRPPVIVRRTADPPLTPLGREQLLSVSG